MAEKEYIEREELINRLEDAKEKLMNNTTMSSLMAVVVNDIYISFIKEYSAADVEPVRHGEWANEETAVTCTACGRSYDTDFEIKRNVIMNFKYCPRCGAKMDGSKVE